SSTELEPALHRDASRAPVFGQTPVCARTTVNARTPVCVRSRDRMRAPGDSKCSGPRRERPAAASRDRCGPVQRGRPPGAAKFVFASGTLPDTKPKRGIAVERICRPETREKAKGFRVERAEDMLPVVPQLTGFRIGPGDRATAGALAGFEDEDAGA